MIQNILKTLAGFMRKRGHLVLIFALLLLYPDIASAVGETVGNTAKSVVEDTLVTTVNLLIKTLNMIIWPLLLIIGDLMSNDLIIGPGMEQRLLSIWQQIRNLVNIAFVLVLLIMAFYNVSGFAKDGNFALKTGLPKLIIGLILVNFTFLGGKLVLDLSNMATSAVFSLPELASGSDAGAFDFEGNVSELEKNLCVKADGTHFNKATYKDIPALTQMFCENTDGVYDGTLSAVQKSRFFQSLNANNIGLIIAVNMGHLEGLKYTEGAVTSISDLAVNLMFSIAMFVVFAVSYIVLALVLVARIAVLWIVMALSPVIVLFYVVPELKSGTGKMGNISEQVLTHILAPIKIGVVLTIGFMMLDAMYGVVGSSFNSAIGKSSLSSISDGALLISGIADLQRLLIAITSIVVLWKAIFSAVDGTIAQGLVEKVKGTVEGVGSTALSYLKYTPLAPISVEKDKGIVQTMGLSFGNLGRMAQDFKNDFEQSQINKSKAISEGIGLDKFFTGGGDPLERLAIKLQNNAAATSASEIKEGLLKGPGLRNITDSSKIRQQYREVTEGLIAKYAAKDETKKTDWTNNLNNAIDNANSPEDMANLIRKITAKDNIITGNEDIEAMLKGQEPTVTTPPASAAPPPVAAAPKTVDMKVTLDPKIPSGVTLTIPTALKIPETVKGFKGLSTANAAAFQAKLKQSNLDAYMKANAGATEIDVDEFNKLK